MPDGNETDAASISTRRSKRKAIIEPIRTDLDIPSDREAVRSETNFSDDDELMDELQTATVEEAKPVTVSKSPIATAFPTLSPPKQGNSTPRLVRTASNPVHGPLLIPGEASSGAARAVSSGAAFLHKLTQPSPPGLAPKKSNIGSSISQRIKALEKLSGSVGAPGDSQQLRADRPSSTFFSVRKPSVREPSRSPSIVERANSITRNQNAVAARLARILAGARQSCVRATVRIHGQPALLFEGGNAPRGRPESIQVTARIVRDPSQPFPKMPELRADPSELAPLDLKQSPLVVDHQKATPAPTRRSCPICTTTAGERRPSKSGGDPRKSGGPSRKTGWPPPTARRTTRWAARAVGRRCPSSGTSSRSAETRCSAAGRRRRTTYT